MCIFIKSNFEKKNAITCELMFIIVNKNRQLYYFTTCVRYVIVTIRQQIYLLNNWQNNYQNKTTHRGFKRVKYIDGG